MDGFPVVLIVVAFVAIAVVAIYLSHQAAKKRREALAALAGSLGWSFDPGETPPWAEHNTFDCFERGHTRRVFNTLRGPLEIGGRRFEGLAGDYSYKVTSSNGKTTTTHTYRFSYLILRLPFLTPGLAIRHEGLLDKLAGAIGFDDIDFESSEFSRRFHVKSPDKRFAYDVVSPRMMEFLLAGRQCPGVSISGVLCCLTDGTGRWEPAEFTGKIGWAREFFGHWPEFLTRQLDERSGQGARA
ncbi:MAG: hypothetical protein WD749_02610 [Phycisphaerales bacterium]